MSHITFDHETEEQFADRLLGGWRAVVRSSPLAPFSHVSCEDIVREALDRKSEPEPAEFLRRLRHLVGPNVNGARLLTEFDDFLLSIAGKDFSVWRIDHDGESSPDDFAFWSVSMSRGDATGDARETGDEAGDLRLRAELSPLAELATAWLLFARAKGIKSASTGEILTAIEASSNEPFIERLGDELLSAISATMTANQFENPAAAPSALSLFLGKNAGEAVEIIDADGMPVTVAFARDESAPKSVRRWVVGPVDAARATTTTVEETHDAVEEWGAPLLLEFVAREREGNTSQSEELDKKI